MLLSSLDCFGSDSRNVIIPFGGKCVYVCVCMHVKGISSKGNQCELNIGQERERESEQTYTKALVHRHKSKLGEFNMNRRKRTLTR